jgi:hypothetical protein
MILAALALALAAATPPSLAFPVADRGGSHVDLLAPPGQHEWGQGHEPSEHLCNAGDVPRWCVWAEQNPDRSWTLTVANPDTARTARFWFPRAQVPGDTFTVGSVLYRGADGSVMASVVWSERHAIPGGEWGTTRMVFARVTQDNSAIVLDMPYSMTAAIRACFEEADKRRRQDECTDIYHLFNHLELDTDNVSPTPAFKIDTYAWTWPGRHTRGEDPRKGPPLRAEDLKYWQDPACTYTRRYRFDAAAGRYLPDAPLPKCAEYRRE